MADVEVGLVLRAPRQHRRAARAAEEPAAEQVAAARPPGPAAGRVGAALLVERLDDVPAGLRQERLLPTGTPLAAHVDLAERFPSAEDLRDDGRAPHSRAAPGRHVVAGQLSGDLALGLARL